jgi:hypothetical protein
MKYLSLLLFAPLLTGAAYHSTPANGSVSPLSDFSDEWNDPKYAACNTAAGAGYMNDDEKNVIYILNLARSNPKLFCSTVVKQYPEYSDNAELINITYYQSLITTMNSMKKQGLLQPDTDCFASAQCHAYNSGITGEDGHTRSDSCRNHIYYNGECCDYGHADPLDIVMSLLIDYAVPSLGHRKICFGTYKTIGVSIQPHKTWDTNAVLDFHL